MELRHEFVIPVDLKRTWLAMLDIQGIAECFPGAELVESDGETFHGKVRVKLGPISLAYQGRATFEEKDEANHRLRMRAEGRDARGSGNASALVVAELREVAGGTEVELNTDLNITGKPAQFGRGVMSDVSNKILGEFVANMQARLGGEGRPPGSVSADGGSESRGTVGSLDAWSVIAVPALKRALPWAAGIGAVGLLVALRRLLRR